MEERIYVKLVNPISGFEEADTGSQIQGKVQPGRYLVEDFKKNYPDPNTDYALIEVPAFGDEDTWVCIRWKNKSYGTIESVARKPKLQLDFSNDPDAIEEKQLTDLLPSFYDFGYDFDRARYPFSLSGFKAPLAPPYTINCCTFVEALLVKAWENAFVGFSWSQHNHGQMMIFSADDYLSPVTCLVNSEMADAVADEDDDPHAWTVVQGWRKQWTSGHTFIIIDHHPETDKVLTLESNASYKIGGVGYRGIGHIKDFPKPPQNWWENENLWTWERMKSVYKVRKQCILKIKNTEWV